MSNNHVIPVDPNHLTREEWAVLDRLRERGFAVAMFMPLELDGVRPAAAQVAAIHAVYKLVSEHGEAARAVQTAQQAVKAWRERQQAEDRAFHRNFPPVPDTDETDIEREQRIELTSTPRYPENN